MPNEPTFIDAFAAVPDQRAATRWARPHSDRVRSFATPRINQIFRNSDEFHRPPDFAARTR
jgi:hypothetical protein